MPWPGSLTPDNSFWFFEVLGLSCVFCLNVPLQQWVVARQIRKAGGEDSVALNL